MAGMRTDEIDRKVAARLRARRSALGIPPRVLDALIGAVPATVERIESGRRRAGAAQLFRLSAHLGVEVGFFFADSDQPRFDLTDTPPAVDAGRWEEARRFLHAFVRIDDANARRQLVELIGELAERTAETEPNGAAEPFAVAAVAVGA